MKSKNLLIVALAAAVGLTSCSEAEKVGHDDHDHAGHSHDDHDHGDHDAKVVKSVRKAGPNGGRVIHSVEPHLEFLVTADRKVKMTALDDSLKPIALGAQVIRLTGGDRTSPIKMNFTKEGDYLISDGSFPEGDDFPIVVLIKENETAEGVFEKFTLNLTQCPTCDYLEYACTCDHGEGEDHDHDHKH